MLKENNNNKIEIGLQKILENKLKCDTANLRFIYFEYVNKNKNNLESCIKELKEKQLYNNKKFENAIQEFEEKINIYNQYFSLLEYRESNNIAI